MCDELTMDTHTRSIDRGSQGRFVVAHGVRPVCVGSARLLGCLGLGEPERPGHADRPCGHPWSTHTAPITCIPYMASLHMFQPVASFVLSTTCSVLRFTYHGFDHEY